MANGKDVDFAIDRFIHDAVGLADDLPEPVGVLRNRVKADKWNRRADVGEVGKVCVIVGCAVICGL